MEKSFPSVEYQTTSATADVLVFWKPFSGVYDGWIRYGGAYISASHCKRFYHKSFYVKRFHENGSRRYVPRVTYGTWIWHDEEMEMKRLQKQEGPGQGAGELPSDEWFIANCPLTLDYLTNTKYDDGTPKGKTRLQVERKGNQLMAVLKDADSGLCLTCCHESASDALLTMELLLGSEDCPWLLDPWPLARPKGRKKK